MKNRKKYLVVKVFFYYFAPDFGNMQCVHGRITEFNYII